MPVLPIDKNYLIYAKTIIYDVNDLTLEDKDFLSDQVQAMSIVQSCLQDFPVSEFNDKDKKHFEDLQQISLLSLFKHHLLSLGFVFVDHVEKLVEDNQGVHELDGWYGLSLTNPNIDRETRDKLPKAIERIQAAQLYFDNLKKEHPTDYMGHLWEAYLKHFPNEENWFFPICTISSKKNS
jgi:hypothetical protein